MPNYTTTRVVHKAGAGLFSQLTVMLHTFLNDLKLTLKVFMGASMQRHPIRQKLADCFKDKPHSIVGEVPHEIFDDLMANATFCLNPCGVAPNSARFYKSLFSLCIPVIVCDLASFPFPNQIDYSRMMIRVHERDIASIPSLLYAISEKQIRRMQEFIVKKHDRLSYDAPTRLI